MSGTLLHGDGETGADAAAPPPFKASVNLDDVANSLDTADATGDSEGDGSRASATESHDGSDGDDSNSASSTASIRDDDSDGDSGNHEREGGEGHDRKSGRRREGRRDEGRHRGDGRSRGSDGERRQPRHERSAAAQDDGDGGHGGHDGGSDAEGAPATRPEARRRESSDRRADGRDGDRDSGHGGAGKGDRAAGNRGEPFGPGAARLDPRGAAQARHAAERPLRRGARLLPAPADSEEAARVRVRFSPGASKTLAPSCILASAMAACVYVLGRGT